MGCSTPSSFMGRWEGSLEGFGRKAWFWLKKSKFFWVLFHPTFRCIWDSDLFLCMQVLDMRLTTAGRRNCPTFSWVFQRTEKVSSAWKGYLIEAQTNVRERADSSNVGSSDQLWQIMQNSLKQVSPYVLRVCKVVFLG